MFMKPKTRKPTAVYFLKVAGYSIKIIFEESEHYYFRALLEDSVVENYKHFISSENQSKYSHLTIRIIDNHHYGTYVKINSKTNAKQYFIDIFKWESKTTIVSTYQISTFQFQAMLWLALITLLGEDKGFIIHSSVIVNNDKAMLFLGTEGAGKSTLVDLWKKNRSIFSDDLVAFRFSRGKPYIYQLPFIGKNKVISNTNKYEIAKIFFIHKADKCVSVKLKKPDVIKKGMLNNVWYSKTMMPFMDESIMYLIHNIGFYNLYFNLVSKQVINAIEKS